MGSKRANHTKSIVNITTITMTIVKIIYQIGGRGRKVEGGQGEGAFEQILDKHRMRRGLRMGHGDRGERSPEFIPTL